MSTDEVELLLGLERRLMDPEFRRDRDGVAGLLAEEFFEFGASGRVWTRSAILELLESEPGYTAPVIEEFAMAAAGPDARLVTYLAVRPGPPEQRTLRSSLWGLRDGRWQVLFHQGTPVPQDESHSVQRLDVGADAAR